MQHEKKARGLKPRKRIQTAERLDILKGRRQIASFLGEPLSVVQRWAQEGMPVSRQGRQVITSVADLNGWLARQAGKPVHIATTETDLSTELKRGLSYVRSRTHRSDDDSKNMGGTH